MPKRTESGFSLIEAMVALVILSIVFATVWGWFGTAVNTTQRIQNAVSQPEAIAEYLRRMSFIDLESQRQGDMTIGQHVFEWQANISRRSDQEVFRRQPAWIVALFEVNVVVTQNGEFIREFDTQLVRQWRDPNYFELPESQFP